MPLLRAVTLFDDLASLPSIEIQNHLLSISFTESQIIVPILHRGCFIADRPPPFLALSLQAVAGLTFGTHSDGDVMFERARREVIPVLSGETVATQETLLQVVQAVVYLITYCHMRGKVEEQPLIGRWMALAVACARQLMLNEEVMEEKDDVRKELRRRLWWMLFAFDSALSVSSNHPPLMQESECLNLRIVGNEASWQQNGTISDSDSVLWKDAFHTVNTAHQLVSTTPTLQFYWSRWFTLSVLMRRSHVISRTLWSDAAPPPITSSPLVVLTQALETWHRCHVSFHTVGDGKPSSAGYNESGHSTIVVYHMAYILAHSPRGSIDRLSGGSQPDPILLACLHAERIADFFAGVMENGRNDDAIMFYDTDVSFLGIFAWEVMYAGVVMMLLEGSGVKGTEGRWKKKDVVGILEKALVGMEKTFKGLCVFEHLGMS
ncbi:fungal-specific transcription factor domain-containing protein [Chytridium lagenaria]|nr:fungal-specific transcription factor domain-containing protein [Chytridium lagenaria]